MPANWNEFITLGDYMMNHSNSFPISEEMLYRCVISRAYYAAYAQLFDSAVASGEYVSCRTSFDHTKLRQHLKNKGLSKEAIILQRLRASREKADYDTKEIISRTDADWALVNAKNLCGSCSLL
ncbi:MAG TPA: hypothetical protein O0X66_06590 [Methanocorpusculum sp.]|nr:hypothetical protein [Methanocorpusculum sp.]HJJ54148.1 hypothetical protein [Methanocorpusculum sp.]